jgi:DNA polymerase-3 subunit epsilon
LNGTYLFFDTETTGLPRDRKAPLHDLSNWPRLVQIAWLLFDQTGNEISETSHIIKPEGFTIPRDALRFHGISTERAIREGSDLQAILTQFSEMIDQAEHLVAHNMAFDEKIVGAEFLRKNVVHNLVRTKRICTMESAVSFCAIDGPYGYKWPTLSQLHFKLFNAGFEETHSAGVDVRATAKCFWEMRRRGLL